MMKKKYFLHQQYGSLVEFTFSRSVTFFELQCTTEILQLLLVMQNLLHGNKI